MRVVLAPDSFKESLGAAEVAGALREGFAEVWPDAEYLSVPLADGGEGTVAALVDGAAGSTVSVDTVDPLGRAVTGTLGVIDDGRTGVVECADASGLGRVAGHERDPDSASSWGTGVLVREALDRGVETVVLGLGGSATNDGGAGFLAALGARLLDADDREVVPGRGWIGRIARLDLEGLHPRVTRVRLEVACDVDNPLLGGRGATAVFGPQKGVTEAQVRTLDAALSRWADVLASAVGADHRDVAGAGAAGGLGLAALALGGRLRPGFDVVSEAVSLRSAIDGADLVVTGEGRVDDQTLHGKAPIGVVRMARRHGVPVLVIGGCLGPGAERLRDEGAVAVLGTVPALASLEELLGDAADNLRRTASAAAALWAAGATATGKSGTRSLNVPTFR